MKNCYISIILLVLLLLLLLANKMNRDIDIFYKETYEDFANKSLQRCDNMEYNIGQISNCINSNMVDCDYDKVAPDVCNKDKEIINEIYRNDIYNHITQFADAYMNNGLACWYGTIKCA